ncbi:DUF302 domain-containing protein [Rhodoblastus acidophilus]|uniref:DUF302 domain-containing protein n=1 Tax=Candidatus Rhodoblastus alkanivorans TaxID=2954117 RepID=A0ABS9Z8Q5_9HYPH|nr:DUF302 domain-containing protein [Candidatus Rhodoblastus alkanivorans]MCI4679606.1 DUF302 domain-containing protein [Candidatus Rhodoblastus alkanivorans]MCI4683431.1 DUF302 domain-containing protein [Candidatus Rhodoblastus alkanivorans]MDI4640741.1 DUF302 domain-containing protein [Rhodoblastus acidophilus]
MDYYTATTVDKPIAAAIEQVEAALKEEGFGVLTRIDVANTLKEKIGADFRPYVILGACNPRLAFEALKREDKVGTMLPCNVVVQEVEPGRSEVAAIDPVASMQAIDNAELKALAEDVRERLRRVIGRL